MEYYSTLYKKFEAWLSTSSLGLSKGTIEQYSLIIKTLCRFMEAFHITGLNDFDNHLFHKFVHIRPNSKQYAVASIRQKIAALDLFFAWAIENSLVRFDNNPVIYYKKIKIQPKPLIKPNKNLQLNILSSQEQTLLLKTRTDGDFLYMRNRCIILLIMATGLHARELLTLPADAVKLKNKKLTVNVVSGIERKIPIAQKDCYESCQLWGKTRNDYLTNNASPTYFFNQKFQPLSRKTLYDITSDFSVNAGIKGKTVGPETLRQTAICNLIRKGYSVEEIKNITGIKTSYQIETYRTLV